MGVGVLLWAIYPCTVIPGQRWVFVFGFFLVRGLDFQYTPHPASSEICSTRGTISNETVPCSTQGTRSNDTVPKARANLREVMLQGYLAHKKTPTPFL